MNQSIATKQAIDAPTSHQNNSNVITLEGFKRRRRAIKQHRMNMLKQRLIGIELLAVSLIVLAMTKDLTVLVFLSMFYLPAIFSKHYVMNFSK